jgi:ParB-like chromosome segregation protein Spo0J
MHRTYEMFLRDRHGKVTFEALTHAGSIVEVMRHARGVLAERGAESIEVCEAGERLFTLLASGNGG